MKLIYSGVAFFLGVITIAVSVLIAQPDNIIINNSVIYGKKERSSVKFPHGLHMGSSSCKDCHHWYQDGKNVLDESRLEDGNPGIKCVDCHKKERMKGIGYNIREAYHLQCMGCHRKLDRQGKKTGPRLCGICHPRK